MQYQVLVENESRNGFIASIIGMPDCRAEGITKEEAVAGVTEALSKKLATSEIVTIDVDVSTSQPNEHPNEHPLMRHFGRFKDDPTFDDFLARIEEYRRELDAEEAAREAADGLTVNSAIESAKTE